MRLQVYTDSAFFFDRNTAKLLLDFWNQHKPITCEIDAYGDFLQALGPMATAEYTGNRLVQPMLCFRRCENGGAPVAACVGCRATFAHGNTVVKCVSRRQYVSSTTYDCLASSACYYSENVISESNDLATTRLKLYEHLKGTRLNVVLCNWVSSVLLHIS